MKMLWVTRAVHYSHSDSTGAQRIEKRWWQAQRAGMWREHLDGEEGIDWVRGWDGPRVDAFKAMLALRPA